MNRKNAEKIITEYMRPVFGFALKHCRTVQDAEDLSQEIMFKVYHALIRNDCIENHSSFIWRSARNALANYYRDNSRRYIGISSDDIAALIADESADILDDLITDETARRLHMEIAYLSKMQIVAAYYFHGEKQSAIAARLGIAPGTVKWHLFEAKKELKRGMTMIRQNSELKFDPIKFALIGTCGSVGSGVGNENYLRGALSQNIIYCVHNSPASVNEIADMLGVSPVYVESEAEYLEENGFLLKQGDKYLSNVLIDHPSDEIIKLHDKMYAEAAEIFANELYDELSHSPLMTDDSIQGGLYENDEQRENYLMWTLIPYIAANSGKTCAEQSVTFDEAATCRPDGGKNICYATVEDASARKPQYYDSVKSWSGPCWNEMDGYIAWSVDSEWSDVRINELYQSTAFRIISLIRRMAEGKELSYEEYSFLSEKRLDKR